MRLPFMLIAPAAVCNQLARRRLQIFLFLLIFHDPELPLVQVCSKCREQKAAAEFHRDCNKPDGLRGRCRTCEAEAGQARRAARTKTEAPTVAAKLCRRCGLEKPGVRVSTRRWKDLDLWPRGKYGMPGTIGRVPAMFCSALLTAIDFGSWANVWAFSQRSYMAWEGR